MSKSERNKTIRFSELDVDALYWKVVIWISSLDDSINKIIHWDSIEELKKIPTWSVDLIATDPPYNLSKNYAGNKFSATDNESYEIWLNEWMKECKRILKDTWSIYVCCDWKSSIPVFNVLNKHFTLKNRITWAREKWRWSNTNWKNNIEDIYFWVKNTKEYTFNLDSVKVKKKVIAPYKNSEWEAKDWFTENWENYRMTCPSNIWTDITIPFWSMPENTEHPTQKPEKVMAKIILASSNEWDIVLDPFVWNGTTAVVAKKLWRKFIWIEQEKEYSIVSQYRLDMADLDKSIQWIENWIFLERNSMSSERIKQPKKQNHLFSTEKIWQIEQQSIFL